MTYLRVTVARRQFPLHLILDFLNREIVGFTVHEMDDSERTANLPNRMALAKDLHKLDYKPVLLRHDGETLNADSSIGATTGTP